MYFFLEISARQTLCLVFIPFCPLLFSRLFIVYNNPSKVPISSHMSRRNRLQSLSLRPSHLTTTQIYAFIHPLSCKSLHLTGQRPPRAIPCTSQTGGIYNQTLRHTHCCGYQACLGSHSNPFLSKHLETLLSIGYSSSV